MKVHREQQPQGGTRQTTCPAASETGEETNRWPPCTSAVFLFDSFSLFLPTLFYVPAPDNTFCYLPNLSLKIRFYSSTLLRVQLPQFGSSKASPFFILLALVLLFILFLPLKKLNRLYIFNLRIVWWYVECYFLKYNLQTFNMYRSITFQKTHGNAESQASLHTHWISVCVLTRCPGSLWVHEAGRHCPRRILLNLSWIHASDFSPLLRCVRWPLALSCSFGPFCVTEAIIYLYLLQVCPWFKWTWILALIVEVSLAISVALELFGDLSINVFHPCCLRAVNGRCKLA